MTLYQHMLLQARAGLSEVDRDRDRGHMFIARYGGSPALDAWLRARNEERAQHLMMIEALGDLQRLNHPALLTQVRASRMVKAALRTVPAVIARTGTHR